MTRTDFTQIRKDVVKDFFLKTTIAILVFVLFRYLLLPILPEIVQSFWNWLIDFIFNLLLKLQNVLLYEKDC